MGRSPIRSKKVGVMDWTLFVQIVMLAGLLWLIGGTLVELWKRPR